MRKRFSVGRTITALAMAVIFMMSGAGSSMQVSATTAEKVNISLVGKYDSADTAAIRAIDLDARTIRFRNHSTGRTYTLSYDNTSMMYDKYGGPLSPALLNVGEVVDVTFLKSTKKITTLGMNDQVWTVENTRDHQLVRGDGTAKIKKDVYKLDVRTLVMAEGELALAEDVLSTDTITARGIGKEVYSVIVTGGHGYVSLSSDTVEDRSLVGAWIELDNEVIHKISPGMLLSAPEGDYKLQILGNGANFQQNVSIARNQETVVDTGKVTISRPKEGLVTFEIKPEEAEVFVDGKKTLTGTPVTIEYGYHNLKVTADGYETQTKYLKVGTPKSVIQIELEKEESSSDATSSASTSDDASKYKSRSKSDSSSGGRSKNSSANKSSSAASSASSKDVSGNDSDKKKKKKDGDLIEGYKVYVDEPYDAELYLDGNYIGIIPTSFNKVCGNHEIILKREGYKTKSYRVNIDSEEVNDTYKFPELVKIKKDDASKGNSSESSSESSTQSGGGASSASTESSDSGSGSSSSTSGSTSASGDSSENASTGSGTGKSSDSGSDDSGSSASTGKTGPDDGADDAASTASGDD